MTKILKVFYDDIKDIFTNFALLIVVLALCILPSLYAWFNIYASWDPYGNSYGNSLCARGGMVVAHVAAIAQKL